MIIERIYVHVRCKQVDRQVCMGHPSTLQPQEKQNRASLALGAGHLQATHPVLPYPE